jgi:transcriptional regulator with XRE-family HTH domain
MAKKLKEARERMELSQGEVAEAMQMSRRKLQSIEAGEATITAEEIVGFAKIYKVDVRELLLEDYGEEEEERILFNRYVEVFKVYDKLEGRANG